MVTFTVLVAANLCVARKMNLTGYQIFINYLHRIWDRIGSKLEIYQKLDAIQISIYTSFNKSLTNFQFTNIHCNNVNNYMKNYQIVMKSEISSYYFKIIILCTKNISIIRSHHMYINYIISFKNITFLCECKKKVFCNLTKIVCGVFSQ